MAEQQLLQAEWDLLVDAMGPLLALIVVGGLLVWLYQRFYDR